MKRPPKFDATKARALVEKARHILPDLNDGCGHEIWGPLTGTLAHALEELERRDGELAALRSEVNGLRDAIHALKAADEAMEGL